mgnify:CR=1 FL=1
MGSFQKIKETFVGKSTKQNEKYVAGLDKSSTSFSSKINALAARYREINDEYFDELENILIMSDVGVNMVMKIVDEIKKEVRLENIKDPHAINDIIVDKMFVIYANDSYMTTKINYAENDLTVILMVGVNGAGKTTTIAKLANKIMHEEGKKVMVAAGDTFRAGAIEQLAEWANRLNIPCVKGKEGGDPSSVIFDALEQARQNFENSLKSDDVKEIAQADVAFHDAIYNATGNAKLVSMLNNLREQMYRYRVEYLKDETIYPRLLKEHKDIAESLRRKDKSRASETMREHVKNQAEAVKDMIRQQEQDQ